MYSMGAALPFSFIPPFLRGLSSQKKNTVLLDENSSRVDSIMEGLHHPGIQTGSGKIVSLL